MSGAPSPHTLELTLSENQIQFTDPKHMHAHMFVNARRGSAGSSSSHIEQAVLGLLNRIGFDPQRGVSVAGPSNTNILGQGAYSHGAQPATRSFEVAHRALSTVIGARVASLDGVGEMIDDAYPHVRALRALLASRTDVAMQITVPRDFVNAVEGFMPFVLEQTRRYKGRMEAARRAFAARTREASEMAASSLTSSTLDDEAAVIERMQDWFELFYPEKDYSVLPLPTLLSAVESFFVYQIGGIDTSVPLGHFRPYHNVEMPIEADELKLYRVLYHWLESSACHSGMFQTALDCGARSGYVSGLLLKAGMNTVVATDDNEFALQNLEDNLKRLKKRGAVRKRDVFTQRTPDLLPKSHMFRNGSSHSATSGANSANPFQDAAVRRRMAGRSPIANVAGVEVDDLERELGLKVETSLDRPFDLITYHRPVPKLFDHPMQSRVAARVAMAKSDPQTEKMLTLLEASREHQGMLSKDKGHVAIISSNYHELLSVGGVADNGSGEGDAALPPSMKKTLAYSLVERANRHFHSSAASALPLKGGIVGWDIVKREVRPLASLGNAYFGEEGASGGARGGIFMSLIGDKAQGYAAYTEAKDFYSKLTHEMVILKPRHTSLYGGIDISEGGGAGSAKRREAVDHLASNKLIDWEDTFEYNHYFPKDGTGNPFHLTSVTNTYAHLADEYYDDTPTALEIGGGNAFYNSSDPADALGRTNTWGNRAVAQQREADAARAERRQLRYTRQGQASAKDAFVQRSAKRASSSADSNADDGSSISKRSDINKSTGTTPLFDLVFNREMRQKRRHQWRKLGFDSNERQRYYLDKKVVESEAAKLQILNELDRFDFKDPSKY